MPAKSVPFSNGIRFHTLINFYLTTQCLQKFWVIIRDKGHGPKIKGRKVENSAYMWHCAFHSSVIATRPTPPPLHCPKDMFVCADKEYCINRQWICDGEDDCKDSSDELSCGKLCQTMGLSKSQWPKIPFHWHSGNIERQGHSAVNQSPSWLCGYCVVVVLSS